MSARAPDEIGDPSEEGQVAEGAGTAPPRARRRRRLSLAARALVVGFGLLPFAATLAVAADGWQPTGDVAVIALRARDAWTADAPLVGQPTTGGTYAEVDTWHPGPVQYWVLGPAVHALGPRLGTLVGVAAINGAALAATIWLAYRRGGPVLCALMATFLAVLVRALGTGQLVDAFNSEAATFPMVAVIMASWSVLARDRAATVVLAASATVAAQVHVAGAAFVALPLAVALVSVVRRHLASPTARGWDPHLVVAGLVLVIGWAPVVAYELSAGPSNIAALSQTAGTSGTSVGLAFVAERVATAVAPIPLFVRAGGPFDFLSDVHPFQVVLAASVIGGVASLALYVRRSRGLRSPALLAALVLASGASAMLAASRTPPLSAVRADGMRWLWVTSTFTWLSLTWTTWKLSGRSVQRPVQRWALPVAAVLCLAMAAATLAQTDVRSQRDGAVMELTAAMADEAIAATTPGTYRLTFDGPQALVAIGPGIAVRLEDAGRPVVVEAGEFSRGYGRWRTREGADTQGTLRVTTDRFATPSEGEDEIAAGHLVTAGTDTTVRVFLSP